MNSSQPTCLIVDDDQVITEMVKKLLSQAGWRVQTCNYSPDALPMIIQNRPDCILLDIMMPELDGLELCKQVREQDSLADSCLIMFSAKPYEFDRKRAYAFGANGYILKPLDLQNFADDVQQIVDDNIYMDFWGVHGTLPVPGEKTLRYGGNTSCVSLRFPRERLFIFDAGTGIKVLSDHLMKQGKKRISSKLFISHSHWDHVNAIPFFAPLYMQGNEMEFYGPAQGNVSVKDIVTAQMDDVYFPITIQEFGAQISFHDLREDSYEITGIEVKTMMLNHPGYCLGYRVNYNGRSICYITDNELFPQDTAFFDEAYHKRLEDFIRDTDALIIDTTYFDDEYQGKMGWGHSNVTEVTRLAHNASVKTLYLFHHDPDQTDDDIDSKLKLAKTALQDMGSDTVCLAPRENQGFKL